MATHKISDVFRTAGQPTITYVKRDSGKFEKQLRGYLEEGGQLCLITGPSKTGKTTLYKEVLSAMDSVPLVVQCTAERTCDDIWRIALEGVNFERVTERSHGNVSTFSSEAEINTTLGWKWLAGITGVLKGSYSNASSEGEVRERILSNPSPDLLIPVLNKTNYVIVIEDFHYLKDGQKVLLFQQWKRFVDSEISIIVLGTSHRSVDIANSNKDLIGRISQIDEGNWLDTDLRKICESGFKHVGAEVSTGLISKVCSEAVGLPIIVQQICLQMFNIRSIFTVSESKRIKPKLSNNLIIQSFNEVANEKYKQFETYYSTLIRGPREKNRKYKTYEIVIACFTVDPITFSLTRHQIDSRISRMKLSAEEKPPAASLNSTLGALGKFQTRRELELLEWRQSEDTLYIVEPSFLFYVRWRKKKDTSAGEQLDLFAELLNIVRLKPESGVTANDNDSE